MDNRKKACTNENCRTYKRTKYSSKINYCPECGTQLVFVCKAHKCFKPLDISQPKHPYCVECEAKRQDRLDKAVDNGKKAVAAAVAFVAVPVVDVVKKEGKRIIKGAAKGAIKEAEKNILK